MINEDALPNPRPPLKHPPLMDLSFAALGWLYRAAEAVGSPRFQEIVLRTLFYISKAGEHAHTPAEQAVLDGLNDALVQLIEADKEACAVLTDAVSGMNAAEAVEFVERAELVDQVAAEVRRRLKDQDQAED